VANGAIKCGKTVRKGDRFGILTWSPIDQAEHNQRGA